MKCNVLIFICILTLCTACSHSVTNSILPSTKPIIYELLLNDFSTTESLNLANYYITNIEIVNVDMRNDTLDSYISDKLMMYPSDCVFIVAANNLGTNKRVLYFTKKKVILAPGLAFLLSTDIAAPEAVAGIISGAMAGSVVSLTENDKQAIKNKRYKINNNIELLVEHKVDTLIEKIKKDKDFIIDNINITFNKDITFSQMVSIKLYAIDYCLEKMNNISPNDELSKNIIQSISELNNIKMIILDNCKNIKEINTQYTIKISLK